jgi:adenosylcobinamide kinase/adenosylcobinamide-phosphate guanylyltransferase
VRYALPLHNLLGERKAVSLVSENHIAPAEKTVSSRLVLVVGGARSGKSAFAQRLAVSSGQPVAFIATALAGDEEMRERIARHRAVRPREWHTFEEPLDLVRTVHQASKLADVLLVDCVTLWLGNFLLQESGEGEKDNEGEAEFQTASRLFDERAIEAFEALLAVIKSLGPNKTLIVVTNEVGLGLVPAYPLGRLYRDTLGSINQRLAQAADRVYLMVAGMAIDLKRLHEEACL